MSYSKLHSSLVNSSLWTENDEVRILFITLLAMCDRHGEVQGSRIGIERIANIVPDPDGTDPWQVLMSPDPGSSDLMRNPENEGRRIEEIPGGFRLLNFAYYRALRNEDDRREQNRIAQAKHRERLAVVSHDKPASAKVSPRNPSPSVSVSASVSDSDWLKELKEEEVYKSLNVQQEFQKMSKWCSVNGAKPSRRRLVNWLNKALTDKPMKTDKQPAPFYPKPSEKREITDEEFARHREIARESTSKLQQQMRMPT